MSSTRDRRVAKELQDIQADRDNSGVYAVPADGSSLSNLQGNIQGPPDTPYVGGSYDIKITIPDSYPFKPPQMSFVTRIYHPNISSQTGAICLDTLSTAWSPVQTIKTALLSLRMLLEFPNPKDPQDAQVARISLDDPEQFARNARDWAVRYAGAPADQPFDPARYQQKQGGHSPPQDPLYQYQGYNEHLVDRFTSMGFDVPAVVDAFNRAGLPRHGGRDYEPEEAYIGDVTAHLLGES